jgi:hypothetical protein
VARGLGEVARWVARSSRERAWEKTVWVWRCARRRMLAMDGRLVDGSKRREWTVSWRSESYGGGTARVGVVVMAEKVAWKAARVGSGEAAKVVGSERRGRRSGLRERAGRLSMREAAKAAEARVVGSGREMPPVVVGRRSWKAVRVWSSERSRLGLMRRMVAIAVAAAAWAASVKVGSFGAEGWGAAVREGGGRRW